MHGLSAKQRASIFVKQIFDENFLCLGLGANPFIVFR